MAAADSGGPITDPDSELRIVDGTCSLVLDLRVYRLTAVKKTAYRLAHRCTAVIGSPDGELLPVALRFEPTTTELIVRETVRAFYQELLDQELREQIAEETNAIRTLILAHAFSKIDLIDRGK